MKRCKGKVVIIIGGGRGIGRGIASAFAAEGANLVITGRNKDTLDTAKGDLEKEYGIEVLAAPADGSGGGQNGLIDFGAYNTSKEVMRRVGDAEKDVGRVCVFLTLEDAKYLTGKTINVDGGNILRP